MIKSIEHKFEYELNSDVYAVAALMDTRRIKNWYQRSFSRVYVTKGLAKMVEVAMKFEKTEIAHLVNIEK